MSKSIKINTCGECPYIEHNNGGGFCSPFVKCDKFNIMLDDDDSVPYVSFDYRNKIHPDCKL